MTKIITALERRRVFKRRPAPLPFYELFYNSRKATARFNNFVNKKEEGEKSKDEGGRMKDESAAIQVES